MNRRDFANWSSAAAASALLGFGPASSFAQTGKPEAGKDYRLLDKALPVDAPAGKVEVVEFFRYSCPHCFSFEPAIDAWVKKLPKDVSFRRVPVSFGDPQILLQKLFYSLDAMGLQEKLSGKVFSAIHVERIPLSSAEAIADWVAKQGVDKGKFVDQYKSFSVATKASRATQTQNDYKVESVPSIGVHGRFITDATLTQTNERALLVAEYLAAQVRAKRI